MDSRHLMDSRHKSHWLFFPALIFLTVVFLTIATFACLASSVQSQPARPYTKLPVDSLPSPEAFVNAVFRTVVDSSLAQYYLVAGSDTCRFLKYDYDEWMKYDLLESVPFATLNELAQKVYLSPKPWFWRQDLLQHAICVSALQADSILDAAGRSGKPGLVYSFSRPYFTDDGQYAVIDLNLICGARCGRGTTFLFRRNPRGWKVVGRHINWSS